MLREQLIHPLILFSLEVMYCVYSYAFHNYIIIKNEIPYPCAFAAKPAIQTLTLNKAQA